MAGCGETGVGFNGGKHVPKTKRRGVKKTRKSKDESTAAENSLAEELLNSVAESFYRGTFGVPTYWDSVCRAESKEEDLDVDWFEFEDRCDQLWPSQLDFYDWKKGKLCRAKSRNLKTERPKKRYCRSIGNSSELKSSKDKKVTCAVHTACKKELKRRLNGFENVECKKSNIELKLKQNCTPRKWPNGMPKVGDAEGSYQIPTSRAKKSSKSKPIYNDDRFILRPSNADKLGEALISQLMAIQDREITPEDFDMLLQLDTFVEAKTVPKNVIDGLQCVAVTDETEDVCMVCMENYSKGDTMKYLPCQHFFHSTCIRTWLTVTSNRCPIDALEVCS